MQSPNDLSRLIVDAAFRAHRAIGPGLLESVYETILAHELTTSGHTVRRQVSIPLEYAGRRIATAFRADLIIDNQVIVEIKSIETILPIHKKQLLTYLRLANLHLGLLINFNVLLIKDGIHRIVNNLED